MQKQVGVIGLGKMGAGLAEQLLCKGYAVSVWNRSAEPRMRLKAMGATASDSIAQLVSSLPAPRVIWMMLPNGVVGETAEQLLPLLSKGDSVIDGGNSFYKDSMRRAADFAARGVSFLDVGVSGGPEGARTGACLMVGGEKKTYEHCEEMLRSVSVPQGCLRVGGSGAGHFVKMVHNGIEYGMMQAIGEGFEVMKRSEFEIDLPAVARLYNNGSVIESRLVGWLEKAYKEHGADLRDISGEVGHLGEGEWTVETAKELGVPVQVIEDSFMFRVRSKGNPSYTGQVVSALRGEFGGHDVSGR